MNAYFDAMKRYGSFSGRSTRSQYWLFTLCLAVLLFIGLIIDEMAGTATETARPITGLIYILHLLPLIALNVRRLHDIDRTGWWVLTVFTPIGLVLLVFACTASTLGSNRFGPPVTVEPQNARQQPNFGRSERVEPSSPSTPSLLDQLEKLSSLRASGAIDEAEFQSMKAALMRRGGGI